MSLFSQPVAALRALAKAAFALTAALALLVGTPVVLLRFVGNPFPTVVPSWDDVSYSVTNGQIDAWTWIKALALVGWAAWANLVAAFLVEVGAALRGATAGAVRGLGATQWFASRVIAQCSLAGGLLFQSTVGVTAIGGLPPLPMVAAPFSAPPAPDLEPSTSSDAEAPAARSVDVGRRDTLWGLAETHLGDGDRWRAIRDANVGRTMPDGTVLAANFTRVSGGWTLLIPDRSTVEPMARTGHLATGTLEIEPGDNLWRLSSERLESVQPSVEDRDVLSYVHDVVARNDDLIDDPDLIYPGQVFTFPEVGELPAPVGLSEVDVAADQVDRSARGSEVGDNGRATAGGSNEVSEPSPPVLPEPAASSMSQNVERSRVESQLERVALVGLGAAGALLAAGARRTLLRRRRFALAHRKPGTVPRPPGPELEQIERAIHRRADEQALRWLEAALGSLATRPIWAGEHVAQPIGVTWRRDHLDVEFSAVDPMAAPLPWTSHDGGRHWLLDRGTVMKDLPTAGPEHPVPTLITVGLGRSINLEGIGLLRVAGPGDRPLDMARSIVHELATSSSAGTIDLRVTMPIEGTEGYDLVRVQSPASLAGELVPWLEHLAPRLEETLSTNAFAYRIVSEDEPMSPVVVVTDDRGAAELSALVSLARRRCLPLAIVVVGDIDAEFSITMSEDDAILEPWAEQIEPQLLNAAAARQLGDLLVSATSAEEDPLVAAVRLSAPVTTIARPQTVDVSDDTGQAPGLQNLQPPWPPPADSSSPETDRAMVGAITASSDDAAAGGAITASSDDAAAVGGSSGDGSGDAAAGSGSSDDGSGGAERSGEPVAVDGADDHGAGQLVEPSVTVLVLGEVEVVGLDAELTSQQLSLLTYLACHGPSSRDSIIDALWDGQVISRSRFPNLLAELRARLGRHHLPEARDARYELLGVATDLVDFERQVGDANKQTGSQAAATLRAAMSLVRGVPLTPPGRRFWSWVGDETYLAARIEALVADTAARLARIEQELGDLDGAQQACEQGLRASPTDETLVVVLTEVYLMQGKPGLARRLVERWEDKISRLECGEPSDEPRKRLAG